MIDYDRPGKLLALRNVVVCVLLFFAYCAAIFAITGISGCTPEPTQTHAPGPSGALTPMEPSTVQAVPDVAPSAARKYRVDLTRAARLEWSVTAPVAMFGAQVEQESSWNPNAKSPYAGGLAQFTPATADWIDGVYPDLGPAQPYNPQWALRALVRYDRHLFEHVGGVTSECDGFAFTLAGYNGGPGWVQKDRHAAAVRGIDSARYWDAVELVNAGRSAANFAENRGYPRRIIRTLQPRYAAWGPRVCT